MQVRCKQWGIRLKEIKETLINSAVRGEVLSLTKDRTMNTEFNEISIVTTHPQIYVYIAAYI